MSATLCINGKTVPLERGSTLFEGAQRAGVRVPSSCQRLGNCGECIVQVVDGATLLSAPGAAEKHLSHGFRLSCQARIVPEQGNIVCHTLRRGRMRIVEDFDRTPLPARRPTNDPAVQRGSDGVYLDGQLIDPSAGPIYGVALDVGTTTVVLTLIDLESGQSIATTAFENPQAFGGSDVMSRILYDHQHAGHLRRALVGYLAHALEELPCDPRRIYEIAVVANTTMRDLLFGVDVWSIGQKPYRSVVEQAFRDGQRDSTSISLSAIELGLPVHPRARVFSLPLIGSHVGADAAACMTAIDIAQQDEPVVVMDMGTNTELIIGHRGRILAASCPAGPAFEGGGISCGMPALSGAIERLSINDRGEIAIQVIDNDPPTGICGSGLVDLLSELRRTGRIQATGRFSPGVTNPFMVDAPGRVTLSEPDISRLAQAKAANVAGLQIVLKRFGIDWREISRFYLAGGFARHLNLSAAKQIGLVPDLPDEKFVQVGNAAIEGAALALGSRTVRQEILALVAKVEHVELETDSEFFDHFVQGCLFEPLSNRA